MAVKNKQKMIVKISSQQSKYLIEKKNNNKKHTSIITVLSTLFSVDNNKITICGSVWK
jgi:hypothetical protein